MGIREKNVKLGNSCLAQKATPWYLHHNFNFYQQIIIIFVFELLYIVTYQNMNDKMLLYPIDSKKMIASKVSNSSEKAHHVHVHQSTHRPQIIFLFPFCY